MRGGLKPLDIPIILIAIAVTAVSAWAVYGRTGAAVNVVVEGGGSRWIYPVDADVSVSVAGPLGETVVRIHDGRADVVSSPCANQTCISAGSISATGQWIACLPNGVMVRIDGSSDEAGIDATTF